MISISHLIVFLSQKGSEMFLEGSVETDHHVGQVSGSHLLEKLVKREDAGYNYTNTWGRLT